MLTHPFQSKDNVNLNICLSPHEANVACAMHHLPHKQQMSVICPNRGRIVRQQDKRGLGMHHSGTRTLFNYWNERRGTAAAPLRGDIAPAAIAEILSSTFILETPQGSKDPAFRLAGTRLCAAFGRELKSEPLAALFSRDDRAVIRRLLSAVENENVICVAEFGAVNARDQHVDGEMLILPLADREPRMIGALNFYTTPYWLGTYPIKPATLVNVRLMDMNRVPFHLANRPSIDISAAIKRSGHKPPMWHVIAGSRLSLPSRSENQARANREGFRIIEGGQQ